MGDRRCGFVEPNQAAEADQDRLVEHDVAGPVVAMWVGGRAAAAAGVTAFAASDREWVLAHPDA
jgi:hypothetical protein